MTGASALDVKPSDIQHLIVLGHPSPDSFNASIARSYCAAVEQWGQRAVLRDLYAMGFNPLLGAGERPGAADFTPAADVARELDLIAGSDVIVLVYPLWFGMPPAIIKGYVDRVLGSGFMVRNLARGVPPTILDGKRLVILSSSASTRPWLEEQGQMVSLHQAFDTYLTTVFGLSGSEHIHFDTIVEDADPQFVAEKIEETCAQACKTCSELLSERHARQMKAVLSHGTRTPYDAT